MVVWESDQVLGLEFGGELAGHDRRILCAHAEGDEDPYVAENRIA